MQLRSKTYGLLILVCFLLVCNIYLFSLDLKSRPKGLTFGVLNVGQGEAIFIESPTGTQVMFDTGGEHRVLGPLRRIMSPFDRSIDAVVITNPDADHIGGFNEILKNYKVGQVFESGTYNDSSTYHTLEAEIRRRDIPDFLLKKGMRLDIGGGVFIDILFPDRDVSTYSTNDGSVVARLTYGNTSIMLTGDATSETEKIILNNFPPEQIKSTVLKVGHHGSRTSSSLEFVQTISPAHAIISNGKNNKYGHPHKETLDTLAQIGAKVMRTDLLGTIILKSDGANISFKFQK